LTRDDENADEPVELPIDGTIDLHTFDPRDVKVLVPHYLADCRARGIREIRIIHGKGRGVLRDTVHALLARVPGVIDFRLADPDAGGWGATLVRMAPEGDDATIAERGGGENRERSEGTGPEIMPIDAALGWPAGLHPDEAPVYTRNALDISAPPGIVWTWLVRAARWPEWYGNCKNLKFVSEPGPDLKPGTVFEWTTFGVRVRTRVEEFEPPSRLAWLGTGPGARGYHGWLIERTGEGCRVVTEETQRGIVPSLGRWFLQRALLRQHQIWLEGLARLARSGPPPE